MVNNIDNVTKASRKISKKIVALVSLCLLTLLAVAGSVYYFQPGEVKAAGQTSKVLIIANDDTYYTVNGGTSATAMRNTLVNHGFDVTVWTETSNGGSPPTVAYANEFDVVIFTQGVGYRNTANNRQGLNLADLNFLKQYLNITATGNKARLIIEGEDVMSDILRVGTSSDQRDVLKINTSSSRDNYRRMTRLRIDNSGHPVFNYVFNITGTNEVNTNYETNYQDYLAPNLTVGAQTVAQARFDDGRYFATVNTWSNPTGYRQVFMPFAWYVNNSNGIANQTWREQFLVNMVSWVGEREIQASATSIANTTSSRGETAAMLSLQLSPNLTATSATKPSIGGLKVHYQGSLDPSHVTVKVFEDKGTIGTLGGTDVLLGSAAIINGVATVNFNMEIDVTKYLIVAYEFSSTATFDANAGARLAGTDSIMVHNNDKLSRVYGTFPINSLATIISSGGTADIKSPKDGSTIRGHVNLTGTASTEYTLSYGSGFNNRTGPWTQFAQNPSGLNNSILGTWNTTVVPDGSYTIKLHVFSGTDGYLNLYVDNTAPAITEGPVHSNVFDNRARITWKTDEAATSEVVYRVAPAGEWQTAAKTARVTSHVVDLTALSANTEYQYKVRSVDAAGNAVESGTQTFTTLDQGPYAGITYPAIVAEVIPRVGGTIEIKGSAYTINEGHSINWYLYYGYGDSPEKVTNWVLINNSSTPVNNGVLSSWETPSPDGAYVIKLRVEDPGMTGPTSFMESYVSVIVDNTLPEIYNIGVENITNTTACIHWETSKNTIDQVYYGVDPGIYPHILTDTDKDKKMFLYDLEPNKTYYFKIKSTDGSGQKAESPEHSFTTTNITSDVIPPVVSAVYLTATGRTESTVDLRWNAATDNTGVAGYKILRSTNGNFVVVGAVPGTKLNYTDIDLEPKTTYWYKLMAVDTAGNESVAIPPDGVRVETLDTDHTNPHGGYSKLTVMCSKCHTTHMGKKEFLFNRTQEATMCYTCHDAAGTGSKYAIEAEYHPDHQSRHPLPMNHTSKECASCHNPHLDGTTFPRLLAARKQDGTIVNYGNEFCYVCHGEGAPDRILDNTGGVHDYFEFSIHNLSDKFPFPESGSGSKCVLCHANHASYDVRLTKAPEEENCYHCHGDTAYLYGVRNIKADLDRMSYHNVKGTGAVTGKVECVNCHNPHSVGAGDNNTSDPYNTINVWTGDRTSFCIRCHDGGEPPQQRANRIYNIPYTVYFPPIFLTTTYSEFGWNKTPYLDSGHYKATPTRVQCNDCHSPHGSTEKRLLARREDRFGDNYQGQCGNCHSSGGRSAQYPGAKDILSTMTAGTTSFHPTLTIDALHIHDDDEEIHERARHSECWDCHESHTVRGTPFPNPDVSTGDEIYLLGNISGVWVDSWPSTWNAYNTAPSSIFRRVILNANDGRTDNDYQWQLCLKCHSKYAYTPEGTDFRAPHFNPSDNGIPFKQTDIAREFNPNLGAGHRVIGDKTMPTFTSGGQTYYYGKYVNGWRGDSKMLCTDCHQKGTGVRGPHGSSEKFLLVAPWDPITTGSGQGSDTGDLCFLCHDYEFHTGYRTTGTAVELTNSTTVRTQFSTSSTGKNLHTVSDHKGARRKDGVNGNLVGCGTCHGGLPHGWKYTDGSSNQNNGVALWTADEPSPYSDGVEAYCINKPNKQPVSWTKHNSGSCQGWCQK